MDDSSGARLTESDSSPRTGRRVIRPPMGRCGAKVIRPPMGHGTIRLEREFQSEPSNARRGLPRTAGSDR